MAKIRIKQSIDWFRKPGESRFLYRIQKRTLFGWETLENKYGISYSFDSKKEANTFLQKYNALKRR